MKRRSCLGAGAIWLLTAGLVATASGGAAAQDFTAGQTVTNTATLTPGCDATLTRLRTEWHSQGGVLESGEVLGTGMTLGGENGVQDLKLDVGLEKARDFEVKLRLVTRKGTMGSVTVVTVFWFEGAECSGRRVAANFFEFAP